MRAQIRKQKPNPIDIKQEWEDLFWHLQERPNAPESKNIEKILGLFAAIGTAVTGKGADLNRLRIALSQYKWVTYVANTPSGYCVIRVPAERQKLSKAEEWEYRAVGLLLNVVPSIGERPRIRRCAECDEWFYAAAREDQKFCKRANCRQAHYEKDPEKRQKKRDKMHDLYMLKKKLAENPKSGIGLERRTERSRSTVKKRKPRTR
jgi:hypothetical protein